MFHHKSFSPKSFAAKSWRFAAAAPAQPEVISIVRVSAGPGGFGYHEVTKRRPSEATSTRRVIAPARIRQQNDIIIAAFMALLTEGHIE